MTVSALALAPVTSADPVSPVPATSARHRTNGRPTTALSDLAASATGSLAVVGRRSAVVVASSGLVVSMFGAPASAAPATAAPAAVVPASVSPASESATGVTEVDTSALTASARAVLSTAPVVTVPASAQWSFDLPALAVVADPPPAAKRVVARASRSAARAEPASSAAVPANTHGSAVLEIAARYVGIPYRSGGSTPSGFDCSGFTSYVFAQLGISLPRTSSGQRQVGTVVSRADAQPGDLIWHPGHVGIYAGGNTLVDSPQPGGSISFREIYFANPVFIRVG